MAKIRISATETQVLMDVELASLPPGTLKLGPEAARRFAELPNQKAAEVERPSAGATAPDLVEQYIKTQKAI